MKRNYSGVIALDLRSTGALGEHNDDTALFDFPKGMKCQRHVAR